MPVALCCGDMKKKIKQIKQKDIRVVDLVCVYIIIWLLIRKSVVIY